MFEIQYSKKFNKEFEKLKEKRLKGVYESKQLLELILKSIVELQQDCEAGMKIPRKLWPKEYFQFGITNLWKYNLDSYWRLTYTIVGNQTGLYLIFLEFLPHNDYDRKFHYHKK